MNWLCTHTSDGWHWYFILYHDKIIHIVIYNFSQSIIFYLYFVCYSKYKYCSDLIHCRNFSVYHDMCILYCHINGFSISWHEKVHIVHRMYTLCMHIVHLYLHMYVFLSYWGKDFIRVIQPIPWVYLTYICTSHTMLLHNC